MAYNPLLCYREKEMKNNLQIAVSLVAFMMLGTSMYLIFFFAPLEATMGIVQKIFYIHVPSAYSMYLGLAVCTAGSIAYVVTRKEHWDMVAKSAAELALVFAVAVMITGPLWGRKAWGTYWTWDPTLTSVLLLTLILFAYVILRNFGGDQVEKRFCAALAILGACVAPIIHISVRKWRGQHPSVMGSKGGGLAPDMKLTFLVCIIAFTFLFIALLLRRYRIEKHRQKLDGLTQMAAQKGLLGGNEQ